MRPDPELAGRLAGTVIRDALASLRAADKVAVGDLMFGARYTDDGSIERTELNAEEGVVTSWVEDAPDQISVLFRRTEETVTVRGMTNQDGSKTMVAGEIVAIVPDAESGDTIVQYLLGYGWNFGEVSTSVPELGGVAAPVYRARFAECIAALLQQAEFIDFGGLGMLDENQEN